MESTEFRKIAKGNITDEAMIYNNNEKLIRRAAKYLEENEKVQGTFFSSLSILAVGTEDIKISVKMGNKCCYDESREGEECTVNNVYSYGFIISNDFSTLKSAFTVHDRDTYKYIEKSDYIGIMYMCRDLALGICEYVNDVSLILLKNGFCGYSEVIGECNLDYDKGYEVDINIPCSHFKSSECKCN